MSLFSTTRKGFSFLSLFLITISSYAAASSNDLEILQGDACMQNREVFIEALIVKTDIPNSAHFGVAGTTNLKLEGVCEPFMGTLLSYHGNTFGTMEDLIDTLKADSKIEIVGSSKLVCRENSKVEMFNRSTYQLDKKLTPKTFQGPISYEEQSATSGFSLCLKPQIISNRIVDLRIYLENAKPALDESHAFSLNGVTYIPQSSTSQVGTKMPVPDGSFIVLTGLLFENNQSVILILRPIIVD